MQELKQSLTDGDEVTLMDFSVSKEGASTNKATPQQ